MRIILLFFFLIYLTNGFCQDKEVTLKGYYYMLKKGYNIKVIEQGENLVIETRKLDSISKKMFEDKQYKKLDKKIKKLSNYEKPDVKTIQSLAFEVNEIRDKYTVQEVDSLTINKNQFIDYYNLFSQMFKTPINILENKNNARIVLDGYPFSIKIRNKSAIVFLQLRSPNEHSHPIIFNFLKETLNLYRKEKPTNNITTDYTFGI